MEPRYKVEYTTVNTAYEEGRKTWKWFIGFLAFIIIHEGLIMIWILFFMDEDETLDLIIWIFITPPKVGVYEHI